jgi:hypothetical protein
MSVTGPPLGWRAAAASTTPEIPYRFTPASFLTDNDRSPLLVQQGLRRPFGSDDVVDPKGWLHLRSPGGWDHNLGLLQVQRTTTRLELYPCLLCGF